VDVKAYFRKIRNVAATISEDFVVVCSLRTEDGGVEGVTTEVSRMQAARLIVDGFARQAHPAETAAHYARYKRIRDAQGADNDGALVSAPLAAEESE
jgi:hypothetical protein